MQDRSSSNDGKHSVVSPPPKAGLTSLTLGSSFPRLVEKPQDGVAACSVGIEELPSPQDRLRRPSAHQADPELRTLSLTTASASAKPQTPSQCRRAAGLMSDTSSRA